MSGALLALALALSDDAAPKKPASPQQAVITAEAVKSSIAQGLSYLYSAQNENGSFGGIRNIAFNSYFANPATYSCWQLGASALATEAILTIDHGERANQAVERGLDYIVKNAKVLRPAEWDIDNNWGLIYGLTTLCAALKDSRYGTGERGTELRAAAVTYLDGLREYQGARGGWGYYADAGAAWRPDWGTSFTTAAALLAILDAEALGLPIDAKMKAAAIHSLDRARLPNGAYDYDIAALPRRMPLGTINQVKGSLGRIQACNHALLRAGVSLEDHALEQGVDDFFEHHKFLDVATNKPIPHEAYYQNAAYFYLFGHYYASFTIDRLDEPKRTQSFQLLQYHLMKCQQQDGSFWDFYVADLSRTWGTAFSIMALDRSLGKKP